MATGTVKWFNPTKGYGFIQPEDGSSDVFVHISAVEKSELNSLVEGQRISYEVVSERGKTGSCKYRISLGLYPSNSQRPINRRCDTNGYHCGCLQWTTKPNL